MRKAWRQTHFLVDGEKAEARPRQAMCTRVTERPGPSPTTLRMLYKSARCDSPVVADQRPLGSAHRQPRTASRCGGSEARRPAACQEASSPPRRASGRSFWRRGVCSLGQAVPVGSTLQHPTASPVPTLPYLLGSSGSVEISSRITVETSRALELPGPGGERATWPGLAVLRALRPQESRHGAHIGFPRAHASCLPVGRGAGVCGNASACAPAGGRAAENTWLRVRGPPGGSWQHEGRNANSLGQTG